MKFNRMWGLWILSGLLVMAVLILDGPEYWLVAGPLALSIPYYVWRFWPDVG